MKAKLLIICSLLALVGEVHADITSVQTSPAGVNGNVQFNKKGTFGADSTFTYSTTTKNLSVSTITPQNLVLPNGLRTGYAILTGSVTANTYYGDGSNLTGITSGSGGSSALGVFKDGVVVTSPTAQINIKSTTGLNVTTNGSTATLTMTNNLPGGSTSYILFSASATILTTITAATTYISISSQAASNIINQGQYLSKSSAAASYLGISSATSEHIYSATSTPNFPYGLTASTANGSGRAAYRAIANGFAFGVPGFPVFGVTQCAFGSCSDVATLSYTDTNSPFAIYRPGFYFSNNLNMPRTTTDNESIISLSTKSIGFGDLDNTNEVMIHATDTVNSNYTLTLPGDPPSLNGISLIVDINGDLKFSTSLKATDINILNGLNIGASIYMNGPVLVIENGLDSIEIGHGPQTQDVTLSAKDIDSEGTDGTVIHDLANIFVQSPIIEVDGKTAFDQLAYFPANLYNEADLSNNDFNSIRWGSDGIAQFWGGSAFGGSRSMLELSSHGGSNCLGHTSYWGSATLVDDNTQEFDACSSGGVTTSLTEYFIMYGLHNPNFYLVPGDAAASTTTMAVNGEWQGANSMYGHSLAISAEGNNHSGRAGNLILNGGVPKFSTNTIGDVQISTSGGATIIGKPGVSTFTVNGASAAINATLWVASETVKALYVPGPFTVYNTQVVAGTTDANFWFKNPTGAASIRYEGVGYAKMEFKATGGVANSGGWQIYTRSDAINPSIWHWGALNDAENSESLVEEVTRSGTAITLHEFGGTTAQFDGNLNVFGGSGQSVVSASLVSGVTADLSVHGDNAASQYFGEVYIYDYSAAAGDGRVFGFQPRFEGSGTDYNTAFTKLDNNGSLKTIMNFDVANNVYIGPTDWAQADAKLEVDGTFHVTGVSKLDGYVNGTTINVSSIAVPNGKIFVNGIALGTGISTSVALGTPFSLTTTTSTIKVGTSSMTVTLTSSGTYILNGFTTLFENGSTFAANDFITLTIYRQNNTPGVVANTQTWWETPVAVSALTATVGQMTTRPNVVYTTTNTNDILSLHIQISAAPGAGSVQAKESSLTAAGPY